MNTKEFEENLKFEDILELYKLAVEEIGRLRSFVWQFISIFLTMTGIVTAILVLVLNQNPDFLKLPFNSQEGVRQYFKDYFIYFSVLFSVEIFLAFIWFVCFFCDLCYRIELYAAIRRAYKIQTDAGFSKEYKLVRPPHFYLVLGELQFVVFYFLIFSGIISYTAFLMRLFGLPHLLDLKKLIWDFFNFVFLR